MHARPSRYRQTTGITTPLLVWLPTSRREHVEVHLQELEGEDAVYIEKPAGDEGVRA